MEIAALIQFILCVFLLSGEGGVLSQGLFARKMRKRTDEGDLDDPPWPLARQVSSHVQRAAKVYEAFPLTNLAVGLNVYG